MFELDEVSLVYLLMNVNGILIVANIMCEIDCKKVVVETNAICSTWELEGTILGMASNEIKLSRSCILIESAH